MPSFLHSQLFQRSVNPMHVQSSFALGYLVSQLFGGILAKKIGGYQVRTFISIDQVITHQGFQLIFYAVFFSSLFYFLSPTIVRHFYFSDDSVFIPNVILGLMQGVIMPSLLTMWSKWLPPHERARTIGFSLSGAYLGVVFINVMLLYVFDPFKSNAYSSYVIGAAGIVWAFFWRHLVRNSPEQHLRITNAERNYIQATLAGQTTHKNVPIPWISMSTSSAVLVIIVATFVQDWAYFTLQSEIFVFFNNFIANMIPLIALAIFTFSAGFLIDGIQKKFASLTNGRVRRQLVCISFIVQILCIYSAIIFAYGFSHYPGRALTFKLIGLAFASLVYVRIVANYLEIAPQFAGVLFGICSTLANLLGVIRPLAIQLATSNNIGWTLDPYIVYASITCKLFSNAIS